MSRGSLKPKWTFRVNAKIHRPIPADADAGRVAAMFGLQQGLTEALYEDFTMEVRPGQIVAVTGPSGAGKSVLMREIASLARGSIVLEAARLARSDQPAVSVLGAGPLSERLEALSHCGLAEAAAMVTPARCLSGGQLHRLALAKALYAARLRGKDTLVIADEFASTLDTLAARVLCRNIRKLIAGTQVALVVATGRAELLEALQPDQTIVKPLAGAAWLRRGAGKQAAFRRPCRQMRIIRGTIADYDCLAGFHYLAGRPAAHKRVYVIRTSEAVRAILSDDGPHMADRATWPRVAAVLVVSPPLTNVRGRNLATGGRYAGPDRAAAMALLNAEVECVSRVVVHPVFRGCGLAVQLVRKAIADARTPVVEALAAMGAVNPFFEKAGMKAYPLGPDRHVARLISAAEAVALTGEDLAAVVPVKALLRRKKSKAARFLAREIALALRRTFSVAQLLRLTDPVSELCRRAARRYVYYFASR